ncbi:putative membrane protein [Crotalus adamanteus]|uniref:Membrane protein n=1 Tax=Crotalus adamanteus TaxID=8729 RepID=A0AAW1AX76_CROAD
MEEVFGQLIFAKGGRHSAREQKPGGLYSAKRLEALPPAAAVTPASLPAAAEARPRASCCLPTVPSLSLPFPSPAQPAQLLPRHSLAGSLARLIRLGAPEEPRRRALLPWQVGRAGCARKPRDPLSRAQSSPLLPTPCAFARTLRACLPACLPGTMSRPAEPTCLLLLLLLAILPAALLALAPPASIPGAAKNGSGGPGDPQKAAASPPPPPPPTAGNHSGAAQRNPVLAMLRDLPGLKAAVIGACAASACLMACLLFRVLRSKRRTKKPRKYDIITTPAERVEMAPLNEEEEEDEDSTVFDIKYR